MILKSVCGVLPLMTRLQTRILALVQLSLIAAPNRVESPVTAQHLLVIPLFPLSSHSTVFGQSIKLWLQPGLEKTFSIVKSGIFLICTDRHPSTFLLQ